MKPKRANTTMLVLRELVTRLSPEKEREFYSWNLAVWGTA